MMCGARTRPGNLASSEKISRAELAFRTVTHQKPPYRRHQISNSKEFGCCRAGGIFDQLSFATFVAAPTARYADPRLFHMAGAVLAWGYVFQLKEELT
jgi:hypothetical protein